MDRNRVRERQVQKCLNSDNDHPKPNVRTTDILPNWLLKFVQITVLFVFGLIMMTGICALIFYICDSMTYAFDGKFLEYLDYIAGGFVFLIFIGSMVCMLHLAAHRKDVMHSTFCRLAAG